MSRGARLVALGACALALAWIGWEAIAVTRADALAARDPQAALRIEPHNPTALLALAWQAERGADYPVAAALARRLLAAAPAQGDGFAVLATALAQGKSPDEADALLQIAVQRSARNRGMRARAAAAALRHGDLPSAMAQLDALLRLGAGTNLYPALVSQATDPRFASALADTLAGAPRWRDGFLHTLLVGGQPQAVDHIFAALRRRGALSTAETGSWLGRMLRDGRWGDAYAHWVATLGPLPGGLPAVYNGGFETDPSGIGFDWQKVPRAEGVFTEFEASPGATGSRAAHFRFIGPASGGDLRQPLLLAPGRYRMQLRARAEFLHTEQGLDWTVTCDKGAGIAALGPLEGSFDWRVMQAGFTVPATGCPGQWLELQNPATAGAARHASGDLWVDDIAIVPIASPEGPAGSAPEGADPATMARDAGFLR